MKRAIIVAWALVLSSVAWSEESASALLSRLPPPPGNLCDPGPEEIRAYLDQLKVTAREIDANLAKRRKEQKAYVKQHEDEWREAMMKQSGLTPQQINTIKAKRGSKGTKLTKAEKKAIAEQALQEYADLTIDEAKKLKVPKKGADGSRPAADARTEAYITQELATAQARVDARTPEEEVEETKKRERLHRISTLAEEQATLMKSIGAGRDIVWDRMRELESVAQYDYEKIIPPIDLLIEACKAQITPLMERIDQILASYRPPDPDLRSPEARTAAAVALEASLKPLREEIWQLDMRCAELQRQRTEALGSLCAKHSPTYCSLVQQYVEWARGAQPAFDRYEELENEKMMLLMQTPGAPLLADSGGIGFQEAKACVDLLRDVFRYSKDYGNVPAKNQTETGTEGVP